MKYLVICQGGHRGVNTMLKNRFNFAHDGNQNDVADLN